MLILGRDNDELQAITTTLQNELFPSLTLALYSIKINNLFTQQAIAQSRFGTWKNNNFDINGIDQKERKNSSPLIGFHSLQYLA